MQTTALKKSFAAVPAFFAGIAILVAVSSCSPSDAGGIRIENTVTVSGVGTVRAQPDTVRMEILLRNTARTTRAAQERVSAMVTQAIGILSEAGVEERNIRTAALRFSPEYEWGQQGRVLLGQRAEQAISFSVAADANASAIIDSLVGINGIELQGMSFSIQDTSKLNAAARELAFREALEKAQQYAQLSGQSIAGTRSVFEGAARSAPMPVQARGAMAFAEASDMVAKETTVLPAGEVEISASISVEFIMR